MRGGLLLATLLLATGLVGCLGSDAPAPNPGTGGEDGSEDAGPGAPGPRVWEAASCTGVSLVWTPSLEALAEVVDPWTPAEGPVPGHGVFVLFAFHCPTSSISYQGGPLAGGAAIVPIEEPEETHGIQVDDWIAVPEAIGDPQVRRLFADHGFLAPNGNATVAIDQEATGVRVGLSYQTDDGGIFASGVVHPPAESRTVTTGAVATRAEAFSVFHGPESMDRRMGTAQVQATGDTWVSRLELAPVPFQVTVDTQFEWAFTFEEDARQR